MIAGTRHRIASGRLGWSNRAIPGGTNVFQFKRAIRSNVSLIIGLAGGTGSGKTYSAMRLASGIAGDKPFAVIDTENGRALHYADSFTFDECQLREPFSPDAYREAILTADAGGYSVVVVDSMSHEHEGPGGLLDMHDEDVQRMAGDDWKKREAVKMAAWVRCKGQHKKMVQSLLQVKAHIILCFRAAEKIEMIREDGKTKIVPKQTGTSLNGWVPICERNLPYEATCSFLLMADNPGVPHPIKLQAQHRAMFPPGNPIDEEAGRRVAAWAAGATEKVEPAKVDLSAMLKAFAAVGMDQAEVESRIGKPLLEWTDAHIKKARTLYHNVTTAQSAAQATI
jgi:hypothetical protein